MRINKLRLGKDRPIAKSYSVEKIAPFKRLFFERESTLLAWTARFVFWSLLLSCLPVPVFARKADAISPSTLLSSANVACTAPTPDQFKAYRDAAAAARTALDKMNPAKADTEAINTALKKIAFEEAIVGKFETVAATLEAGVASRNGRFAALRQAVTELNGKVAELNRAYIPFRPCEDDSTANTETKTVIEDFKALNSTIQEQLKVGDKLQEAIKSIPEKAQEFIALIASKAQGAVPLSATLAPQTLRSELARTLPDLARALRVRRQFAPIAERISKALDPAVVVDIKGFITQKPEFSFDRVDAQLTPALAKVRDWAEQAAQVARDQQAETQDALQQAMRDPFHRSSDALARSTIAEGQRRDFTALADAFLILLTDMQREDVPANVLPPGFIPTKARELSNFTEVLQLMSARFARAVVQLSGEIPIDKSTWTMASIDLFYFDNVERLIRVLSPNARLIGGDASLKGHADEARVRLNEKSQELAEAEAAVSDRRQEVANSRERVRVANARTTAATQIQRGDLAANRQTASAAAARARAAKTRSDSLARTKTRADDRLTRARTALEVKPDDIDLQKRVAEAQAEADRAAALADQAKAAEDSTQREADAAAARVTDGTTDIDAEVEDLTEELGKAQEALNSAISRRNTATDTHRAAMRTAFMAAQAENFAFAQARDHAPFWTSLPEPRAPSSSDGEAARTPAGVFLDSDPVSRVLLFAFPDSRTIFIRGPQEDIDLVRQIIKEFDQPQGQAMMTLRTMEISSDGTKESAKRALSFLTEMDRELVTAQQQIEGALSELRGAINDRVKVVADLEENRLRERRNGARSQDEANFFQVKLNRREEIETTAFYDRRVLDALGWRNAFQSQTVDTHFLNAVIPPPANSVNLAQALIILSLASAENRKAVADNLSQRHFVSLKRFLGSQGTGAEVLGFQTKLVEALRFNGITHVLEVAEAKVRMRTMLLESLGRLRGDMAVFGKEFDPLSQEQQQLVAELAEINRRFNRGGLSEGVANDLKARAKQNQERQAELTRMVANIETRVELVRNQLAGVNGSLGTLNRDLPAIIGWLQGNTVGIAPEFLIRRIEESIASNGGTSGLLPQALGLRRSARYRFSQASESAVNLTFRRYLEQVNRDLNDAFVKPAFRRLNGTLLEQRLGVGVIQETSILASNRLVARVDPRGSAQLAVGEERDMLEAARQLTSLFGLAGKGLVSGATGNPLALAGGPVGGVSSVLAGAQSIFNALDQMPREAAPEVYGITTGNLFQVTPVIDPSGQALRFRFDLVSATQIREPNETINPQMPRIERHSVNTEVQLADQEIRLISQFQANSRLGIAKRKSGGFPILKDIPGVSEVPLIGWFVKRGGRAAQTQQSLIFCQTTMYPTLSEVLDASVKSPSFTGLETP
jgi:hypothetical protein